MLVAHREEPSVLSRHDEFSRTAHAITRNAEVPGVHGFAQHIGETLIVRRKHEDAGTAHLVVRLGRASAQMNRIAQTQSIDMPLQFVTHIALAEDVQLPIRIILMNPPHGIDERDEILLRFQTADGQYRLLTLGNGLYLGIQSLRIQGVLDNRDLLLQELRIESLDLLRLHDDLIRTLIQQAAYGEGELGMLQG